MTDQHERYEQDLAAYVLGALEDGETRALEAHLAECEHCSAERDRLTLAADALPRSVLQVRPPESLRASIMAEVHGTAEAPRRRRLRELLPRFGGVRPQLAWAGAAAVLAVGVVCGWGVAQLAGSDDPRVITAEVDESRIPFANASLVVPEDSEGVAILRVNGMPTLPSNRVYQLWLARDGETVPQGLFTVGEDGTGTPAVRSVDDADAVLVTREAAGGARAPSEEPILRVTL
jgi:anti-sigma-K factor RskA